MMGSPLYMSPEQMRVGARRRRAHATSGRSASSSTSSLTGRLPFAATTHHRARGARSRSIRRRRSTRRRSARSPRSSRAASRRSIARAIQTRRRARGRARAVRAGRRHALGVADRDGSRGSQPHVSAPRSACCRWRAQLTGFGGTRLAAGDRADRVTAPPPDREEAALEEAARDRRAPLRAARRRRDRGLRTRPARPSRRRSRRSGGDAADRRAGHDDFESRELTELRAQQAAGEQIIDKEKVGSPDDRELAAAIAEARAALALEHAREDREPRVKASDCVRANGDGGKREAADRTTPRRSRAASKCTSRSGRARGSSAGRGAKPAAGRAHATHAKGSAPTPPSTAPSSEQPRRRSAALAQGPRRSRSRSRCSPTASPDSSWPRRGIAGVALDASSVTAPTPQHYRDDSEPRAEPRNSAQPGARRLREQAHRRSIDHPLRRGSCRARRPR